VTKNILKNMRRVYGNLLNPYPYENSLRYKILTSLKLSGNQLFILWPKSDLGL
jgi:hypothetical protein